MPAKSSNLLGCILGAAIVAIPAPLSAQDDKPSHLIEEAFIGDLAFTQERGEIQISSLMRADGASANRTASVPLEIEYGITDAFQVSIETGGYNYARPAGWSSPGAFGLQLRYGRYGLLPNLHASVTIEGESEEENDNRILGTSAGLQLGVDIPALRMTHLFTSIVARVWNSEQAPGEVGWSAGTVVPFGRLRATIERQLKSLDAANGGTVTGLVWKLADGLDLGAATTLRTQPRLRATGAMLSLVLEF